MGDFDNFINGVKPLTVGAGGFADFMNQSAPTERRRKNRIGEITGAEIDSLLNGEHGAKIRNFFGAVKKFEGGQPNLIVGGKQTFDPNGDHPNIVGLRTAQGNSTAAGDYQITGTNWYKQGLKRRLGAKNFSPENQLKAAVMLFADRDNRAGLNALINGDYATAEKIAAKDWAALPSSKLHPKKFDQRKYENFLKQAGSNYVENSIEAKSYLPQAENVPRVEIGVGEPLEDVYSTADGKRPETAPPPITENWTPFPQEKSNSPQQSVSPVSNTFSSFLSEQEKSDLNNLGNQTVGKTSFGADYPKKSTATETLPIDYQEYLKVIGSPDSPELRNEYNNTVLPDIKQAYENSPVKNTVEGQKQTGVPTPRLAIQGSESTPQNAPSQTAPPPTSQAYAPGTYENIQNSTVGTSLVDLAQKPAGVRTNQYLLAEGLRRADLGLTDEEINDYVANNADANINDFYDRLEDKDLPATLKALKESYGDTNVQISIPQRIIDDIQKRRPEAVAQQTEQERQRIESENAEREAELRQRAIDEITEENIDDRKLSYDGSGNIAYNAETGRLIPLAPTEDEINRRVEELRKIQLDDEAKSRAVEVGKRNESYGVPGQLWGGAIGGAGRSIQFAAGLARPLQSLGISAPYEWLSKTGAEMQLSGETSAGKTWTGAAANLAGGLPLDLARLAVLSKLPGGMVVGFSADHALLSAGRGESASQVKREAAKGALIGSVFGAAKPIAGRVADTFGKNAINFVDAFPSNAAYKAVNAGRALVREGTEIAVIGGGTYQISKAFGSTDDEAGKEMIANTLFHVANKAGTKAFDKIYKIWKDGRASDVYVDSQGKVKLLKGEVEPSYVDAEIITDPKSNAYQASENAKRIGGRIETESTEAVNADNVPNSGRAPNDALKTSAPPRELVEQNPLRAETADPQILEKINVDSRAQKVIEQIKDGKTINLEQLQKQTRLNKANLENAVESLYEARQIEINPDNSIRFIGNEAERQSVGLYDRIKNRNESQIGSSDSRQSSNNVSESGSELLEQGAEKPVNTNAPTAQPVRDSLEQNRTNQIYEALPPPANTGTGSRPTFESALPNSAAEFNNAAPTAVAAPPVEKNASLREQGAYTKDGVTYTRPAPLTTAEAPTGDAGRVQFAGTEADAPFEYRLIEADKLQPSHLQGNRNPNHFLPEAQPKITSGKDRQKASDDIAKNPDLNKAGHSPNAYFGAPVVNERAETIQGNNRSEAFKKHYAGGGAGYKQQLVSQAESFGFRPSDVENMRQPVLVRMVKVSDDDAIRFGNYTAQDLESGGTARIDPVALAQRIPNEQKAIIVDKVFHTDGDFTLNELIRDRQAPLMKSLEKHLTPTQIANLRDGSGGLKPDGIKDLSNLMKSFLLSGGDANLPAVYEELPHVVQQGVLSSLPKIFNVPAEADLIPEIQNATLAAATYRSSGIDGFDVWARQSDMFSADAPVDRYTATELALANALLEARTQKDVKAIFGDYAALVNGQPATMFEAAETGKTKAAAIEQLFGVKHNERIQSKRSDSSSESESIEPESGTAGKQSARRSGISRRPESEIAEPGTGGAEVNPQFAVAGENVSLRSVKERIFAARVKKLAENAPAADVLIARAKFETRDGAVLLNPEATEYVRQVIASMFGESQPAFLGGYLKPVHIEMFSNYLENDLPDSGLRSFAVNKAGALLKSIVNSADAAHNDTVILSNSPEFPDGLPVARQEEFGHRFNARSGVSEKFTEDVIEDVEESYQNVEKDYSDYTVRGKLDETFAKSLRDDAETALGVSKMTARNNRRKLIQLLQNADFDIETKANELEKISRRGEGLAKYVRKYGNQYGGRFESAVAGNNRASHTLPESNADVRRTGLRDGGRLVGENPDRFARLRQTENLGANRSGNESLTVRLKNEILFDRVSDVEINPEEVKTEAEKSVKTLLSYIYDGKRDVSPTEAAMNIMRTGYLAGLSVIKTNVLGNTSNIVVEQLAKPLMATADILNPKAKQRTTPGLSARDVIQGFFGKDGFFRSGFVGDKGFLTALTKGVDTKESARVDMNVADKQTNFVRNTGVPLIDLTIEATKRLVTGIDRPFKAYARSAEKSGLARLEASKEKLTGIEWRKRMNELRNSPTAYINETAERYAETVTFQNPNAVTQTYDKFRKFLIDDKAQARAIPTATQRKIAKYVGSAAYLATGQVAPFMSTPSNVGFRTLEYFFPTGVVAAAFKFYRIGKSFERQNFVEEQGLNRAKIVKRLAGVRAVQDRKFNSETSAKKERLNEQKKAKNDAFKREIETVRNSKVFTDAAKNARIEQLKANRDKWLEGWESNRDKYLQTRTELSDKATAGRKVVDDIQRKDWESEDAYADLKFSAFENRAFAEAAGRAGFGATVGSLMLLGVIYGLIKAVGTTDYDDEKEKSKKKKAAGIPDDSVSIGGYRFPYADNPFGNALKMGINLFEQYERPGDRLDRAGAMAERFGKDITSLNPLTEQGFTKKDWASYAGSKANSMTPLLNLKILQEIGEIADDKPRKYWEEGFAAQYLIKLPKLRESLPESESFIGGEEERGDVWRRAIRAVDPLKTTKENSSQDDLPKTPLSKKEENDTSKDKKLDGEVRKGKITTEEAIRVLTADAERGDISPSQYKQRIVALSQSKSVKELSDADARKEQDFVAIEKILKNAAPEDKPMLEKVLVDKAKAKLKSKNNRGIADGQKLLEIHGKYFPLNK